MLYINSNFHLGANLAIDDRFVLSKEQMLNANPNIIPDVYFCICSDDGQFYLYNKDNAENAETGKYEKLVGGGGQIIQVDVLSEAVQSDVGKIYQYIGETTDEFTNGYFYKCIANDDGTYSWGNIPVQEGNGNTSLSFWQPNTDYKVNDLCLYKETNYYSLYICVTEHTSADAFVSAYWETIGGTGFEEVFTGDDTTPVTEVIITHALATKKLSINIYDETTGEKVYFATKIVDENVVQINSDVELLSADQFRVVIIAE